MKQNAKYLIGLDALRCLLAICILLFHFYHFSTPFMGKGYADKSLLPFSSFLMPLYIQGGFAVEIFWLISGIIFYHFYLEAISAKGMKLKEFLFLRFSRLYPLHLLTLISVAVLQYIYIAKFHETFIYDNNDALHFGLNFFMINFWNAKFGLSFNGPFWSVSVEMFVYLIFFLFAKVKMIENYRNLYLIVILFFLGYCLGILSPFYECLLYFFTGCLIINRVSIFSWKHLVIMGGVIAGLLLFKYRGSFLHGNHYVIRSIDCFVKLLIAIFIVLCFGKTFSKVTGPATKILREMGNMTYAVYMIHVSVEMILVLCFFNKGQLFFNTPIFFFLYITGVLMIGLLSYRLFEMPIQLYLRKKWDKYNNPSFINSTSKNA